MSKYVIIGGSAAGIVCPPGCDPGTYIAVRLFGTIDGAAPFGVYTFAVDPGGNTDFTDASGSTFGVPLETGYLEVIPHNVYLDHWTRLRLRCMKLKRIRKSDNYKLKNKHLRRIGLI